MNLRSPDIVYYSIDNKIGSSLIRKPTHTLNNFIKLRRSC